MLQDEDHSTSSASSTIGSIFHRALQDEEITTTNNIDDDYVLSQISPLTDRQEVTLSLLMVLSASLSILGSSTIVYKVVRNRSQTTPYDRIMMGLSLTDIIASLSYALSPFLIPAGGTSPRIWAVGNEATCSFLGWLTQFSFAAVWYNAILSFYYLLTVRLGVHRKAFAQKYEVWFHASAWVFFLITATTGAALGWYSEFQINLGCWVGEIPQGCEAAGTCTGTGQLVGWVFGGFPLLFTYVALIANNTVIYGYVRNTLSDGNSLLSTTTPSTTATTTTTSYFSNINSPYVDRSSRSNDGSASSSSQNTQQRHAMLEEQRVLRQQAHVREVASQGFLYVATFFISYTPAFILRILDGIGRGTSDEDDMYALLILNASLLPLQGFFNMFVHTRPSYFRFRAAYPDLSWVWALRQACFDNDIPRYSDATLSRSSLRSSRGGGNSKSRGGSGRLGVNGDTSGDNETNGHLNNTSRSHRSRSRNSAFSINLDILVEHSEEEDDESAEMTKKELFDINYNPNKKEEEEEDSTANQHSTNAIEPLTQESSSNDSEEIAADTIEPLLEQEFALNDLDENGQDHDNGENGGSVRRSLTKRLEMDGSITGE
jgi:hypothetical protein